MDCGVFGQILSKRNIAKNIYKANAEAKEYTVLQQWFPFADSIYAIEKIRCRGDTIDGKKVAVDFFTISKKLQ